MKNFKTLFLLLIVAMLGISLQSCGGDDDDSIYSTDTYTLQAKLTEKGTMTDQQAALMDASLALVKKSETCTLDIAKAALDLVVTTYMNSDAFDLNGNTSKFTFQFQLLNSAGKLVYYRTVIVDGENHTLQ